MAKAPLTERERVMLDALIAHQQWVMDTVAGLGTAPALMTTDAFLKLNAQVGAAIEKAEGMS